MLQYLSGLVVNLFCGSPKPHYKTFYTLYKFCFNCFSHDFKSLNCILKEAQKGHGFGTSEGFGTRALFQKVPGLEDAEGEYQHIDGGRPKN